MLAVSFPPLFCCWWVTLKGYSSSYGTVMYCIIVRADEVLIQPGKVQVKGLVVSGGEHHWSVLDCRWDLPGEVPSLPPVSSSVGSPSAIFMVESSGVSILWCYFQGRPCPAHLVRHTLGVTGCCNFRCFKVRFTERLGEKIDFRLTWCAGLICVRLYFFTLCLLFTGYSHLSNYGDEKNVCKHIFAQLIASLPDVWSTH